jgi:hypothetical protein
MTTLSRRHLLQILAGGTLCAAWPAAARESTIERLIAESRAQGDIGARIDFISKRLIGARYRENPLVGSPRKPEKFIVSDTTFDCVTYCETVLAAAMAHDASEFERALKQIRYHNGEVN